MSAIRTASGLGTVARISARNPTNALKEVAAGHLRNAANVLKDIAGIGGMTATASPSDVYGYGNSHASIVISTSASTVSVEGGDGSNTYLWTADIGVMQAVNPTSPSTVFRSVAPVAPGDGVNDSFTCTATDGHGNIAESNIVTADVSNLGI